MPKYFIKLSLPTKKEKSAAEFRYFLWNLIRIFRKCVEWDVKLYTHSLTYPSIILYTLRGRLFETEWTDGEAISKHRQQVAAADNTETASVRDAGRLTYRMLTHFRLSSFTSTVRALPHTMYSAVQ